MQIGYQKEINIDQYLYLNIDNFVNLPDLYSKTDEYTNTNNEVGLIVKHVQQNNKWLEHIEEHRSDG